MDNSSKIKEYKKEDLTVQWNQEKCIHSKECWKGLIQVFNPSKRPWIDINGATSEKIKSQIDKCPSGALTYKAGNAEAKEIAASTKVEALKNGPLIVHGLLYVTNADGSIEEKSNTTAFCRCGASQKKPYCDGTHRNIAFEA